MKLRYSSLIAEEEVKLYFALKQADLHNYTKAHHIRIFVHATATSSSPPLQVLSVAVYNHFQRLRHEDSLMAARKEREEGNRPEAEVEQGQEELCCTQTTCPTLPAAI